MRYIKVKVVRRKGAERYGDEMSFHPRSLQWKWRWLTVILLFFDEIVLEQRLKWVDDDIEYIFKNQRNLVTMQYCLNERNRSNFFDFFFWQWQWTFRISLVYIFVGFFSSLSFDTLFPFFCLVEYIRYSKKWYKSKEFN